ncbi:MAG TPA: folate-binding protein [Anaeromyxobacteraceae bacterium]|nr:folate-binding protein [Anaeromyxobacteraceae bacterium]
MNALSSRLAAAREKAAVGPVLARGLLHVTGKDRLDYLHRMCTQRVNGLSPGSAVHAAFLNVKGRVLAEGMLVVGEEHVLLDVDAGVAESLRAHLAKYVIMDEVEVENASAKQRVVPVLGPVGIEVARKRAPASMKWENPRRGAPCLDLVFPDADVEAFRAEILAAGAISLSENDLDVLRVMAGVGRYGAEIDDARLPMEAGLLATGVSFDKGCYLGQEVVLRGTVRGQIQKGLVQLALPQGAEAGALLMAAGQEVGRVTSAVDTPEGRLGLGYLRRAHWNEGERLGTQGGEAVVKRVLVRER